MTEPAAGTAIRRADARFLLSRPARNAAVAPAAGEEWAEALRQAGVPVVAEEEADLLVGDAGARAPTSIVEGPAHAGRRFLALPSPDRLELVVPLDDARTLRYALRTWAVPRSRWKRARNAALRKALEHGLVPRSLPQLSVVGADDLPYLVAAAREYGGPAAPSWFATFGGGDVLSRGAFHLTPAGASVPSHVLKFSRLPGYVEPFERDERGLALPAQAGGVAAAHAPRLVARFDVGDVPASLETAAIGERLASVLRSRRGTSAKLAAIDRIAAWTVELARETRGPAAGATPSATDALAHWGASGAILASVGELPGVLAHGDLWSENVLVDGTAFTAVDWEFARAGAPPLWDLWFFLSDALATLAGADDPDPRVDFLVRLWRGEAAESAVFDRWTRVAAAALKIDDAALGPLATLLWLQVGLAHLRQNESWETLVPGSTAGVPPTARFAELWLDDALLGPTWRAR